MLIITLWVRQELINILVSTETVPLCKSKPATDKCALRKDVQWSRKDVHIGSVRIYV